MSIKCGKIGKITAILLSITLLFCSCGLGLKMTQKSNVIMGSVVTAKIYGKNEKRNTEVSQVVLDAVSKTDLVISKNNSSAELYKLNQKSGEGVTISRELFNYLKTSGDIFSLSDGKVSISSGALTQLWGIDTDDFKLPDKNNIISVLPLCIDEYIYFNDTDVSVKAGKGQVFNLGAVGKGIACDEAVKALKECSDISGAVISVGGSLATYGVINNSEHFTVGIRNPFGNENEYFATLNVGECFVSTSGSYEKTFEADGKKYHHILDLTTGYPVENGLCSVTVVADNGLVSDALSTMCFALGEEQSKSVLQKYQAQAIFVYNNKDVSVTEGISNNLTLSDSSFNLV